LRPRSVMPRSWRLSKSIMENDFAVLKRWLVIKPTVRRTPMCESNVNNEFVVSVHGGGSLRLSVSKMIVPAR